MTPILRKHGFQLLLGYAFFFLVFLLFNLLKPSPSLPENDFFDRILSDPTLNVQNELDALLINEIIKMYDHSDQAGTLLQDIRTHQQLQLSAQIKQNQMDSTTLQLTPWSYLAMVFQFFILFIICLFLIYYGSKTIGLIWFIKEKHTRQLAVLQIQPPSTLKRWVFRMTEVVIFFIAYSPAYVIAYSFKSGFISDSLVIYVVLAVISNGALIGYAQKFYNLLLAESGKGYVEMAIVKGLNANWEIGKDIRWKHIVSIKKQFDSHLLNHIYPNAKVQFIATLKELAAFMITSLVIIEMALNFKGFIGYELLQHLLSGKYFNALWLTFALLFIVKLTELIVDLRLHIENIKVSIKPQLD